MKNLNQTDDEKQHFYWRNDRSNRRDFNHHVIQFYAQQRIEMIQQRISFKGIKSALDVGCGSGSSTYYMGQVIANTFGMDRSIQMLEKHPMRSERVCLADGYHLPFVSGEFDLVYAWEVLHHVARPELVISEMTRVSRRYVLIAEANPMHPAFFALALIDQEHRWLLHLSPNYLKSLLTKVGLTSVKSKSGGWLFPNITPIWFLGVISCFRYINKIGMKNWVLGQKYAVEKCESFCNGDKSN